MSEIWHRPRGRTKNVRVDEVNPLNVIQREDTTTDLGLPPVAGRSVFRRVVVPGIATGAAYADKDVMGTIIRFPNVFRTNKNSGLLISAYYYDVDDEGLQVDLHLFGREISGFGNDNAAFAPTDADMLAWRGTLQFTTFFDFNTSQASQWTTPLQVFSDSVDLYGVAQARGALNIAAENLPRFALGIVPD